MRQRNEDGVAALEMALITEMEATPRAVWFTSGTPAQVRQQVRQTMRLMPPS